MRVGSQLCAGLIRRHPLRLILIALCAMICFTGQLGLGWASDTITASRQTMQSHWGENSLSVYTENVDAGVLANTFGSLDGVASVREGALSRPMKCTTNDGKTRWVRFFTLAGCDAEAPALSYGYAQSFGALSGLTLEDGQSIKLKDTAAMPMYTGVYVDRFTPSTDGDLLDVYVTGEQFRRFTGESYVNYAKIIPDGKIPPADLLDAISGNEDVFVTYGAEEDPAFEAALALEAVTKRMCALFPWVMLGVGLIFISIFLAGVARRSADSITALRTCGAGMFPPFWGIFLYGFAGTALGFCGGVPLGIWLAKFVAETTLGNMGIPMTGLVLRPIYPLIGVGASLMLCLLAAAVGLLAVSGKISKVRTYHVHPIGDKLSSIAITGLSTAVAMIMVLMSMMFMDSLDAVRREQFSDRYGYDVQIIYGDFVPVTRLQELQDTGMTERCEPMLLGTMTLISGEKALDVTCAGLSETPLLTLRDDGGKAVAVADNGIALSRHSADALGVAEGDLIQAEIRYGHTKILATCCVSAITEQSAGYLEAVSIRTVEQYLNSSGMMNSVAVKVRPGERNAFCDYARSLENVHAVQTGDAAQRRFDSRYAGTRLLVKLIIFVAVALGLSVCLLMCYMQWKRQSRRISILHCLGKSRVIMTAESGFWRICGTISGGMLGVWISIRLQPKLLAFLSTDTIRYPLAILPKTVGVAVVLCLSFEFFCQILFLLCASRRQNV